MVQDHAAERARTCSRVSKSTELREQEYGAESKNMKSIAQKYVANTEPREQEYVADGRQEYIADRIGQHRARMSNLVGEIDSGVHDSSPMCADRAAITSIHH
jgi:anaerobic ribonucleoside-triphosphate reductase